MAASAASPEDHIRDWNRFVRFLVAGACALFGLAMAFLLAVDPYDTGRTGILGRSGLQAQYPTTAHASRARNPTFNAAIFGNSHMQQLSPERLNALTGLSFVSLTMPGTMPADQLTVLGWFLASHRTPPRAVVIGADAYWCRPQMRLSERFPAWLYTSSFLEYLVGLVRYRSLESAATRLVFLRTGLGAGRADGYWDYRPLFADLGLSDPEASSRHISSITPSIFEPNAAEAFPAFDALRAVLRKAPRETTFVLVRPPVYRKGLPETGTPAERTRQACAAAAERLAAEDPRVKLIDLLRPGPVADDIGNFYDFDHYRDQLAAEIEKLVAARLPRT